MRYIIVILLFLSALSCKQKSQKADSLEDLLVGEWGVADFEWKILTDLSPKELQAYSDYAQMQKRIFQQYGHFVFNKDKSYIMDFKGNGGDTGTWSIQPHHLLVHQSNRYKITDTIQVERFSNDEVVLLIASNEQMAKVTLYRKR